MPEVIRMHMRVNFRKKRQVTWAKSDTHRNKEENNSKLI